MDSWPPSAGSTHTSLQRPRWSLDTHNAPLCHVLSQERQGRPEGTHSTCMGRPHSGGPRLSAPTRVSVLPIRLWPPPSWFWASQSHRKQFCQPRPACFVFFRRKELWVCGFRPHHVLCPPVAAPTMRLTISHPGSLPRHHAPHPKACCDSCTPTPHCFHLSQLPSALAIRNLQRRRTSEEWRVEQGTEARVAKTEGPWDGGLP